MIGVSIKGASSRLTDGTEALERSNDLLSSVGLEVVHLEAKERHGG
jgi:hypothetical protein